ncbi:MAG: UDP-glucose 4-epimerase GalE [Phycisphaerales bacterium]|nr:MAG: UDP-glucose 4-epimerase GalE [Phycisphaerales bacterium]
MKVLVTGGAGYVGSHCLRVLLDRGHEAVVVDNLATGFRAAVDKRAVFVEADIGNEQAMLRLCEAHQFDAVMHFAACLDVAESVREPLKYFRNNVSNTAALLSVMQRCEIRKLIFSSTCAIFGAPPKVPITEDLPKTPISPYGQSKLCIEWMLEDCAQAWGLGSCALRYFNAAGASADASLGECHDPECHLIPIVLQVALGQRDKVLIFGTDYPTPDGTCIRDYVHVEDLAEAHLLAQSDLHPGEARHFNVGTGRGSSVSQIIEAARRVTGHPVPAEPAPRRPGDPPELYADPSRIKKNLGWQPRYTDIDEIVSSAWKWHRSHPTGYA